MQAGDETQAGALKEHIALRDSGADISYNLGVTSDTYMQNRCLIGYFLNLRFYSAKKKSRFYCSCILPLLMKYCRYTVDWQRIPYSHIFCNNGTNECKMASEQGIL